jgi:membrane protease YdiL (CAAX protease family)
VGLMLFFAIFFGLSGLIIGKYWLGTDLVTLSSYISDPPDEKAKAFVYFYQFFNQLGVFFVPVFIFLFFVTDNRSKYLQADKKPKGISVFIAVLMIYSILPFINYLTVINSELSLPHSFWKIEQWMRNSQNQADRITKMFLSVRSTGGLMLNLLIVALVPALGEELLFRGVMQPLLSRITRNIHWGVIITSLLFSAMHMQFYGFLPRFVLGLLLGYLLVFSKNLWLPVTAHFVNNASSVIIFYLHYNGYIKISMDDFGATSNTVYITGSFLITLWLFSMLYQKEGAAMDKV